MSEKETENPKYSCNSCQFQFVTKELCDAYRQLLDEKINGLKKAIYVSGATVGIVLTVVNFIVALFGK